MNDLERRVDALEQSIARSDERLVESVDQLAEETAGLNTLLHRVDTQQQALAALGRQVETFEVSKASRADLVSIAEAQERESLAFRKRMLQRIYFTAMILGVVVALIAVAIFGMVESRQDALRDVCKARAEQNSIIIDVLEDSIEGQPSERVAELEEAITRFRDLDADCETL